MILTKSSFIWNGISLALQEHTLALTLGTSELTLVDILTQKLFGSIFLKLTVQVCPVAKLMHVERHPYNSIISDSHPKVKSQKVPILGGGVI